MDHLLCLLFFSLLFKLLINFLLEMNGILFLVDPLPISLIAFNRYFSLIKHVGSNQALNFYDLILLLLLLFSSSLNDKVDSVLQLLAQLDFVINKCQHFSM
jgi:hypothetical protein